MNDINLIAVVSAAAGGFFLGGAWYSPVLFGRIWNREAGRGDDFRQSHSPRVFVTGFVLALISAVVFAIWIGPQPELNDAIIRGLTVGACFVSASMGINYQFANRSSLMWLIDGGYHTVRFVIYGLVLGLWH